MCLGLKRREARNLFENKVCGSDSLAHAVRYLFRTLKGLSLSDTYVTDFIADKESKGKTEEATNFDKNYFPRAKACDEGARSKCSLTIRGISLKSGAILVKASQRGNLDTAISAFGDRGL